MQRSSSNMGCYQDWSTDGGDSRSSGAKAYPAPCHASAATHTEGSTGCSGQGRGSRGPSRVGRRGGRGRGDGRGRGEATGVPGRGAATGPCRQRPSAGAATVAGSTDSEPGRAESAASDDVASEAGLQRRRVKDEILAEIRTILEDNSTLQRADFDGHVVQFLHAVHGVGGSEGIRSVFRTIHSATVEKTRRDVRNWPAYLVVLLKRCFADLSAKAREERQRAYSASSASCPTSATAAAATAKGMADGKAMSQLDGADGNARATTGHASARAATTQQPSRRPSLVSSHEVPSRVHAGQLMNPEDSQFICRICLDLCEDPTVLPCSHLFCRACLRTLVDCNTAKREVQCPACRAPFAHGQVHLDDPSGGRIACMLIDRIKVCCAFVDPTGLPDPDDDPLHEGHAARSLRLCCNWVGTVASYTGHIEGSCWVAARLRRLEAGLGAESAAEGGEAVPAAVSGSSPSSAAPGAGRLAQDGAANATTATSSSMVVPVADSAGGEGAWIDLQAADRWRTGDFVISCAWKPPAGSQDGGAAIAVEVGDRVFISEVNDKGWAYAAHVDGRRGWLPRAACRRRSFEAVAVFAPDEGQDSAGSLVRLEVGNRAVVYHREERGWAFGARLEANGSLETEGWFPVWAIERT
mmetsp:Transcript_67251/g.217031  ORF Transcript_67251/g.217031 Transcript_67251/m.217031 type:complete len:639 (-) Transcript_67251:274-2190(-)